MKPKFTLFTLIIGLFLCTQSLFAQPTGTHAPNFTLQDLNGNTHDLYTYLGQGKIVVLDFFATWCGPCIGSLPGLEDLYHDHGPNGDNTMVLLSIEMDPGTSDEQSFVSQYNVTNPVFDNGHTINNDWNINAFPTFIVVCPDDTTFATRIGGIGPDYTLLDPLFDACATTVNDAKITNASNIDIDFCPGEGTVPGATVTFRNIGSSDLTSLDFVTKVDGNVVNTYTWTGTLGNLDYDAVMLPQVTGLTANTHSIVIEAQNPNTVTDENPDNNDIDGTLRQGSYSSNLLTLNLKTDYWGSETTWKLQTSSGTTLAAGGPYANGDTTTIRTMDFDLDPGDCYQFTVFDQYSDGMCCGAGNGYFEMIDQATGQTLFRGGDFKQRDIRRIDVNTVGMAEYHELEGVNLYPNPATEKVNIDLDLETRETVEIEVLNMNGSLLMVEQAGQLSAGFHSTSLDISGLQAGIYLLRITAGAQASVKKLVVIE